MKTTLETIKSLGFQVQKGKKNYYAVSGDYKNSLIEAKSLTALLDNISIFLKEIHIGKNYNELNSANEDLLHITNLINNGYTHFQTNCGCIKVTSKNDSFIYALRNGKGTGLNIESYDNLEDALKSINRSGWGEIKSYK